MKKIFYLTIITLFIAGCGSTKELKNQNQSLSNQINDFQTELTTLSSQNEKLNSKIISLEKTNKNIDTRLSECNDNINSLTSIYYTYNSKIQKMRSELEAAFPNNLNDANFAIIEEDGRLIIRLPNRILYASGSAEFNNEALMVMQKLSKIFRNNQGLNLLVEGHTDDLPLRIGSKYEDNWDLSLARAVKITRQLETYGVHPQRLTAAGRANFSPIDRTVSEEARAKNRRTEIIIRPKIAEVLKAMSDLNK
jgi:chemotaxis protein MotB